MLATVGSKGQVVIEQAIREALRIQPGWQALQMLVGDHVEIRFLPPEHNESMLGAARPFIQRYPDKTEDWDEAVAAGVIEDYANGFQPDDGGLGNSL